MNNDEKVEKSKAALKRLNDFSYLDERQAKASPGEGTLATGHDFKGPALTPEQFYEKLKYVVGRIKADSDFRQLSFNSRYQIGHLEDDFARMIKAVTGKEIDK